MNEGAKRYELETYQRASNSLRRLLETLGLKREPKPINGTDNNATFDRSSITLKQRMYQMTNGGRQGDWKMSGGVRGAPSLHAHAIMPSASKRSSQMNADELLQKVCHQAQILNVRSTLIQRD